MTKPKTIENIVLAKLEEDWCEMAAGKPFSGTLNTDAEVLRLLCRTIITICSTWRLKGEIAYLSDEHKVATSPTRRCELIATAAARVSMPFQRVLTLVLASVRKCDWASDSDKCAMVHDMVDVMGFDEECMGWHIIGKPNSVEAAEGYCYLSLFNRDYYEQARSRLGRWPRFVEVVVLPHHWFKSFGELNQVAATTDDYSLPFPALITVTASDCLRGVVDSLRGQALPAMSLAEKIREVDGQPMSIHVPATCDLLGGVTKWRVTTTTDGGGCPQQDGYCYMMLFVFNKHPDAKKLCGRFPTLREIVNAPSGYLREHRELRKYIIVSPGDDQCTAFQVMDVLRTAAMSTDDWREGSIGAKIRRRSERIDDGIVSNMPQLADHIGGKTSTDMGRYVFQSYKRQLYVPPLTEGTANAVLAQAMRGWRLDENDECVRDQLLSSIAEVTVGGSCNERIASSIITVSGKMLHLSEFLRVLSLTCNERNSFRVWARSYNGGEMCVRVSGLLDHPDNEQMRMQAMTRFKAGPDYVHLCFDLVRSYARTTKMTYLEQMFVRLSGRLRMATTPMTCFAGSRISEVDYVRVSSKSRRND